MTAANEREILRVAEDLFDVPEDERPARLASLELAPEIDAGVREILGCTARDDLFEEDRLGEFAGALIREDTTTSQATPVSPAKPSTDPPSRIGPYRIVREIGRGGMGVVYEAQQTSPKRRVALKVVLPHLLTDTVRARFLREAEVLGQLQHVGIAHIYEAVLDDGSGCPFFAMEYIEGQPLDAFAQANDLDLRDRLALFAKICDAVQHAHLKGILHRDLKPGNILVVEGATRDASTLQSSTVDRSRTSRRATALADPRPQPKILDFGIARVTDGDLPEATLQTEVGQIIGTLAYMSPEQLEGDSSALDSRCDVYALGVILFELLTGKLPRDVRNKKLVEIVRIVQDRDAPSAADIDPRLRGDVATILAKALARERERRYTTAAELAADIRRHLDDEPIEARAPSAVYQLKKFVRRHRGVTFTAALAILAGIGLTIWALLNARAANENARSATENARSANENARIAQERERELSRLSDQRDLRILTERFDNLWPATVENGRQMDAWLRDAEALIGHLPTHEETLEALATLGERSDDGLSFADKRTHWWYETLQELIADLRAFAGPDVRATTIAALRARRETARRVESETRGDAAEAAWQRTREAIRTSAAYEGLDLPPQPGLVPLGEDPRSGLHEFWLVQTGSKPARNPQTGRQEIVGHTGIVLVLLPGGAFHIGSSNDPSSPNYTTATIYDSEQPPTLVSLDPFFCSKYETTQGQWMRTMGEALQSGLRSVDDDDFTKHPARLLDWYRATEAARRMGCELPSEAQWEYACRGGTNATWFVGDNARALASVANLADVSFHAVTQFGSEPWDDGHKLTAPVGSFEPNPFGLHDVHGNVWEWTRDQFQPYFDELAFDPSDGSIEDSDAFPDARSVRGGSFQIPSALARSAVRSRQPPDTEDVATGFRVVMRIVR